jgi:hypothetical protein
MPYIKHLELGDIDQAVERTLRNKEKTLLHALRYSSHGEFAGRGFIGGRRSGKTEKWRVLLNGDWERYG